MPDSPRRVLILIGQLGRGGAERQVHELAVRLDRERFVPIVVTFEAGGHYQGMLAAAGVEVIVLDKRGWREADALKRLATLMRRRRIDLVHGFLFPANWRAVAACAIGGVTSVVCGVRSSGTWMNARQRFMDRAALRGAAAVVVNAPAVRDEVIRDRGLPPERVRVIMNGVDASCFFPGETPHRGRWLDNGGPLIGFVGSLREAKDPMLFLEVAAGVERELPRARFVMVGDGGMRAEVEAVVRGGRLGGGKVILAGELSDIPDVMRALDLLVVTSNREGCCNAILEAMATGVPVVATNVGGNPDLIVDGENGRLFPHGDAAAGAAAVIALVRDQEIMTAMGKTGLARARRDFTSEAMVTATARLYEDLVP
jgi:glycosyltransferase involved in cell wall biosynthesis